MSVSHVCHVYVTRVSRLLHVVCAECAYSVRAMGVQCVCGVLHVCSVTRVCVQRVQCLQSRVWCVQRVCNVRARSVHSVQSVCNGCAMCVQCVCNGCVMCAVGVQRVQRVGNVSNKCSGFTVRGVCATGVQWVCTGSAVGMHRARWCVCGAGGVQREQWVCKRSVVRAKGLRWVCTGLAQGELCVQGSATCAVSVQEEFTACVG